MKYKIISSGRKTYVEITDDSFVLESEQDALDIASLCFENGTDRLLIHSRHLSFSFFDLTTGLAGAALQKFSNYRITFAAIVPAASIKGRFGEFVLESNRGRQFRFFTVTSEAENWISGSE